MPYGLVIFFRCIFRGVKDYLPQVAASRNQEFVPSDGIASFNYKQPPPPQHGLSRDVMHRTMINSNNLESNPYSWLTRPDAVRTLVKQ